jgi:hypothetical protein
MLQPTDIVSEDELSHVVTDEHTDIVGEDDPSRVVTDQPADIVGEDDLIHVVINQPADIVGEDELSHVVTDRLPDILVGTSWRRLYRPVRKCTLLVRNTDTNFLGDGSEMSDVDYASDDSKNDQMNSFVVVY